MKFRPLHDRVVVRRLEGEQKTAGGIIIPDTAKEKPSEGEIIAVGPGGRPSLARNILSRISQMRRIWPLRRVRATLNFAFTPS